MALATGVLTFSLTDLVGFVGESIDPTRVRVWIESNLPDGALVDTDGNVIRLGNPTATLSATATGSFTALPLTTFVDGMQYRVTVAYPDAGTERRKVWSSGWFDFTASGDLADQDMQATAAPITWQTTFTDSMEAIADEARAYRDQAHDISGIDTSDDVVSILVTPSSGSATTAELASLYADKAATASALAGKVATALVGIGNGVASLDSAGKVPADQLPASVMEYQGVWNASTNTPMLVDGSGNSGDQYRVNVAGTRNLGSGSQVFVVGDFVIYDGSVWQKAHGGADAVQSVAGLTGAPTAAAIKTALGAGSASGLATLGADGKVPAAQLPTTSAASGPLNRVAYNPATAATVYVGASGGPWDVDATNLAATFTAPASGKVRVLLESSWTKDSGGTYYWWSLHDGSGANVIGSDRMIINNGNTSSLSGRNRFEIAVSGLTPGQSYTYKWAHRCSAINIVAMTYGGTEFGIASRGPAIMEVYAE